MIYINKQQERSDFPLRLFTNHGSISILFDEDPTWKPTHTLLSFHCPLDYCHFPGYYRSKAYKGLFVPDCFNTPHTSSEAETNIKTTDNTCFVDGGFGYKHTYNNRNDADLWAVGARPGVAVNLTKKLSFVSHVGFLGWSQSKDNNSNSKTSRYGFDLDGNDITFSLYYNF